MGRSRKAPEMNKESYQELFLSEAGEILSALGERLVHLEKYPVDRESVNEIFRQAHSLKSMAATMGYEAMARLTHEMENMLESFRTGKARVDSSTIDLLFQDVDALQVMLKEIESSKEPGRPEVPGTVPSELQTVRVPLDRLDHLMNLAGELVINKIRLENLSKTLEDKSFSEAVSQMSRLTQSFQEEAMELRLVPLDSIFKQFPRMVRDLSKEEAKEVDLEIEGSEIGLDRTILDGIHEPLHHLLRNSVTHGIEPPEARVKSGKKRSGIIRLSARREENFVLIEVSDDGKGMGAGAIRKAAVRQGVISEEEAARLNEESSWMLITAPGFTMSTEVTKTQGRGVGMNVVRTSVESFGGSLSIRSTPGAGTTFTMKLPLSMAIVQALLAKVGGETFAIPLANVIETLKVDPARIQKLDRFEVISYREDVLALIRLRDRFGFTHGNGRPDRLSVVVVEVGHQKAGLVVDQFLAREEVVIKTLKESLKQMKGIAGATILGDGRVALILDVGSSLET